MSFITSYQTDNNHNPNVYHQNQKKIEKRNPYTTNMNDSDMNSLYSQQLTTPVYPRKEVVYNEDFGSPQAITAKNWSGKNNFDQNGQKSNTDNFGQQKTPQVFNPHKKIGEVNKRNTDFYQKLKQQLEQTKNQEENPIATPRGQGVNTNQYVGGGALSSQTSFSNYNQISQPRYINNKDIAADKENSMTVSNTFSNM